VLFVLRSIAWIRTKAAGFRDPSAASYTTMDYSDSEEPAERMTRFELATLTLAR
jgi:hypothetical protein